MLERIILAVIIVPEGLTLGFEADAELHPIMRRDEAGQLQDECEGVVVLGAVHVVHEGAVDVGEADPRVVSDAHHNCLLKPDVPDLDGARERALLQGAVLQADRVLDQVVPEAQVVGRGLLEV